MPIDLSTSALSIANAKTITLARFRIENSHFNQPTATDAVAQYNRAVEKWPALMALAAVLVVMDQQATVDPVALTAAVTALVNT